MNIFFFIGSLEAGGAERAAVALCSHWANNCEYTVTLATGESEKRDFYSFSHQINRKSIGFDYKKKELMASLIEQVRRFFLLRKELINSNCDIIIASTSESSIRCAFASILLKKKIVICEHNNYYALKSVTKRLVRLLAYRFADKLVLLTERDIENYRERNFSLNNISVIPNPLGIENTIMPHASRKGNLLAVGRLCEQKAFHRLIQMLPSFPEETKLTIVGEGPLRSELERLIFALGLELKVNLVGLSNNIADYYQNSSILLMTSIYEGLPMVINEANAFGLPVIAYDCPTGPREMIENGINGFVVVDNDSASYVERVELLLSNNELLERMRKSSFEKSQKFTVANIADQWRMLFAELNVS